MRIYILASSLIVAVAALVGFVDLLSPAPDSFILYAAVLLCCIGMLWTGGVIRSMSANERIKSLESQLSAAEARFQAFFSDPAVGIGILGLDRKLVDANPTFFNIFGYSRSELIGVSSAKVTYPDDDPNSVKLFMELLAGQRDAYEADRRYIRKNGEVFWAHVTMTIVRGSDSAPDYLVGVLLDIDKQKRNALALQESEARFRAAFECAAIGMAEIALDGRILRANAAICAMSGYTEEELQQRYDYQNVYSGDRDVGMDLFQNLLNGARDHFQVERRYVRKNGDIFWTNLTLSAVRDINGAPLYTVVLIQDVTEQKRALEELRKSEARFQAVFKNAAVGISLISLDGNILAINPVVREIFGYDEKELQAIGAISLIFPEDLEKQTAQYQDMLSGRRNTLVSEMRYFRKEGGLYWVRVNYSLVFDDHGNPDYLIGLVEDIDEKKRTEEKLAVQEESHRRMLEQRIAERTEELNQANQLLQQKAAQDAAHQERTRLARDLHDAVTQTLFSASLIADVLPTIWENNPQDGMKRLEELRQLTRGALAEMRMLLVELRPNALTEIPLNDLIRQLCESVIGRNRLPIQVKLQGQRKLPGNVHITLYRIAQEALNNIVKHARATQVVVTLRMDEQVRLVIADNGNGFDMHAVTPDHFGLKIMRERAEAIAAQFSIYSEINEGTQVSVTWQENQP